MKKLSTRLIIVATTTTLVLFGLRSFKFNSPNDRLAPNPPQASYRQAATMRPLPPRREGDYVGSDVCASCHAEICDSYSKTAMGRSLTVPDTAGESATTTLASFSPIATKRYSVEQSAHGVVHHETTLTDDGAVLFDRAEPVSFTLGSGARGKAFLIHHDGLLYQSPIGWYAGGDRWDLSPGYQPHSNPGFSRRIDDGCLYCHSGATNPADNSHSFYSEPVFTEMSIGCERCHGPAKQHVELHRDGRFNGKNDTSLVNPASLSRSSREAVCNQCHQLGDSVIPRAGRRFFDFRPGDELSDVFVVLHRNTPRSRTMRAVSQVEQMESSVCYQASQGELGCISCHDAHRQPPANEVATYYRDKCQACHKPDACGVAEQERHQSPAGNSCVACHMPQQTTQDVPHTGLTDHRIARNPSVTSAAKLKVETKGQPAALLHSNYWIDKDQAEQLPGWEIERAVGIAEMTEAWNTQNRTLARSALQHLAMSLPTGGESITKAIDSLEDVPLLEELAAGYYIGEETQIASQAWQRIIDLQPENTTALLGLAMIANGQHQFRIALEYVDRLLQRVPRDEQALGLAIQLKDQAGDIPAAVELAQQSLRLQPNRELRQWLAKKYEQLGRPDEAKEQLEIISRLPHD